MWIAAADSSELAAAYVPAVWAFLGIVVTVLGTIAVQSIKSRSERASTPPSPVPVNGSGLLEIAKDIGQLDQRANDNDVRDDMQDKRLDHIERVLDTDNPDWRRR